MRRKWLSVGAAVVVVAGCAVWAFHTTTQVEISTAEIDTGPVVRRILASGTIQATHTVDVGTQVSGIVDSLAADFNSIVHANQVVARLDPSLYDAALEQAKATLLEAQANLNQVRASLDGATTAEEDARTKYSRAVALSREQLMAQADLDAARIAEDEAIAGVHSADAAVSDAAAQVQQAVANVSQAQVNRDHTVIHSPIDGIVLSRNVDVGQTVAAAVQAPVLFTIATDMTRLQIQLNVDQSDVGELQSGRPVTFEVESYPDETFEGMVSQVRLQPIAEQSTPATTVASSTLPQATTSVPTVVSYAAMIDVDNPDQRLRPGMTAEVLLQGMRHDDVTRIPNTALSFRPPPDVLKTLGQREPSIDEHLTGDDPVSKPRAVWTFDGRQFKPVPVRVGLASDQWTELVKGDLHAGETVVTRAELRTRSRFSTAP